MSGNKYLRALTSHACNTRCKPLFATDRAPRKPHDQPAKLRRSWRLSAIASGAAFVFFAAASVSAFAQVQYSYDPNGRLVQVTMPNGASANYTYDPDGNILSITNSGASAISVTGMSPQSGSVGTTVTLLGTGFDTTPANNVVKFNGTSALIGSSSTTMLQVVVPSGATSGVVTVSNSRGSANAPTPFSVTANTAPTITQVTPGFGAEGAAITLTGTGFDPATGNDTVSFGTIATSVSTASATSLTVPVPTQSSSGTITVSTSGGQAVSATDFYAIPSVVSPANVTTKLRLQPGAAAQAITLASAAKSSVMIFDAKLGQNIYFSSSASNFAGGTAVLQLFSPTGELVPNKLLSSEVNFGANSLPTTGTYTALLTSRSSGGHVSYQLAQAPNDATALLLTDGSTVSMALATDQGAAYTINGNAGDLFDISFTKTKSVPAASLPHLVLLDSQGNTVSDQGAIAAGTSIVKLPPLPSSGTFTAKILPVDLATTASTVQLIPVPSTQTGTLAIDGAAQAVQLARYQSASFTFNGTAGQQLYLKPTQSTFANYLVAEITAPDGTNVLATDLIGKNPEADDLDVLPASGVYTVSLTTTDNSAGAMNVALNTKPADLALTTTVNGPSLQAALSFDQGAQVSFVGMANQGLWIKPTAFTFPDCLSADLLNANNTVVTTTDFCDTSPSKNDLAAVATTGNYHLHIYTSGNPSPGSTTFSLLSIPSDSTGPITVNGSAVTVSLAEHQNGQLSFAGTKGDILTFATSGQTLDSSTMLELLNPSGKSVGSWYPNTPSDTHKFAALATTGTYVVYITPSTTAAGNITVKATK